MSGRLEHLQSILVRREKLLSEAESLQKQFDPEVRGLSGKPARTAGPKPQVAKRRGPGRPPKGETRNRFRHFKHNQLAHEIVSLLRKDPSHNYGVTEVSKKLKASPKSVESFFYQASTRIPEVIHAGPGRYHWKGPKQHRNGAKPVEVPA